MADNRDRELAGTGIGAEDAIVHGGKDLWKIVREEVRIRVGVGCR